MTVDWYAIKRVLDDADRDANPVGTIRHVAITPRASGQLCIDGLPGTWEVRGSWYEAEVWMHEIERTR